MTTDDFGGVAVAEPDEFGGVPISASGADEFGGMPVESVPVIKVKRPTAIDPNAPGGFNSGGTQQKITPDTALGEDFGHDLLANASRPAVALPKFTVDPKDSKTAAVAKSAANLLISVPEFMESPLGVATVGAGGVIPKTVAAAFLGDTAKNIVENSKEAGKNWDTMKPGEKAAAMTDLAGQTVLAAAMAHGASGGMVDAIDTKVNPAGRLARELDRTQPTMPKDEFGGIPVPIVQTHGAPSGAATAEPVMRDIRGDVIPLDTSVQTPAGGNPPGPSEPTVTPASAESNSQPEAARAPAAPVASTDFTPPEVEAKNVSAATEATPLTEANPGRPTQSNIPLVPVEVPEAQVKAMRSSVPREAPPSILDDISNVTSGPVQFAEKDFATTLQDARQSTLSPAGRPTAATARLQKVISGTEGMPADKVLQAMAAENPKYADMTRDQFAQAIIDAHTARENGPVTEDGRILAEQQARDALFKKANTSARADVESMPVEYTQIGDTFTMNGQQMTVVEHPVDADTGKPFGVTIDGAYGRQTIPAGQKIHMDAGTLKEQPEFIGMGGAVPGEFHNTAAMPTGIKIAAMDAQRIARRLEPLSKTASRSFANETWQQTLAKIDDNPEAPAELVKAMKAEQEAGQPRALTDHDVAMLLYREADLSYQRAKLSRDMSQAEEDAKTFPNRAEELPTMRLERARIADELDALEQVIGQARSETGRGLAALRNMVLDNYTLAAMEFSRKAAKGGTPLTSAERTELVKLRAQIEESTAQLDKARAVEDEERSKRLADEAVAARIAEVTKQPGYDRQVQSLADRIVTALEREAVAARARLKEKLSRLNAGIDPTLLTDLATVGAAHIARGTLDFARWSKLMVDDFGENVVPWLNQAWAKSNDRVDTAVDRLAKGKQSIEVKKRLRKDDVTGHRQNIVAGLKKAAADSRPLDEQGDYIRRLMENFIQSGLKEREPLVDAIHHVLTEEIGLPDISRRDVREAMANYGKFKALNPDEIKAQRRDLSHQIAQTLKLEDIMAKRPLPRSGVEQHTPSTEGRLLQQQVNEAKRKYGVVVTDAARQLKGALDARKTALKNRIADLEFQIAAGERTVKTKTPTAFDSETKLLEAKRDDLKRQLDEVSPRPGISDAERVAAAERSIERENALLEEQIKSGEVTLRSSRPLLTSERLDALKARRTALRAERDELRAMDPQYQASLEQRAIKSYVARMATSAADFADRAARKDFAPRQVKEAAWKQSPEVLAAIAKRELAKQEFQRGNELARQAQRNTFEKAMDGLSKWKRTFVLSWPTVLLKLTSAATEGIALLPFEEAAGTPFAKAFKGISDRAPRHGGGLNVRAEVKAITDTVTLLIKNASDAQRTGRTQLDLLYGKPVILPRELKDWVSNFHYALKTPLMQNEFSRSFSKIMQAEAARGVDVSEPLVMQRIGNQAYKLANKAIFKENNLVVNMYRRALNATRDKVDGKQTRTGKIAETALRFTFPVVDIPTTIVKRTFEYMLGAPLGLGRAAWAYRQGIENLKPDEAEAIMRNLKRGSLGGAVLLVGFFNAKNIGGYYQPHEKRDPKDVKAGGLRLFGHDVPRYLVHNPLLEMLQIGATMRRVADARLHPHDAETMGVGAGAWAAMLGLVDEVPFMQGTKRMVEEPTPQKIIGESAKSMIPGAVQSIANYMDKDSQGNTISRNPKTIWQTVETGIPGLRKRVPAKVTQDVAKSVDKVVSALRLPKGVPPDVRANLRAHIAETIKTTPVSTNALQRAVQP